MYRLSATQIYNFSNIFLVPRYDSPKAIPEFHKELWELCCSEEPQVAIAAPRGHAKSTSITHAYVIANILFRRYQHVLIISANEELASAFLNDIKVELQENEGLIEHFGVKKFLKDRETEVIILFSDGGKCRIIAKGAEQRMRGLKWERKRPDLVICDDLEDDEIVDSKHRREKFRRWFYGALKPILKDGGRVRYVGTILHFDSLLNRLMPPEKDKKTKKIGLKTIYEGKRAWKSVLYEAHNDDFSLILWPEQYSKEDLLALKLDYFDQGILDVYNQEYRNRPLDDSVTYFRKTDFRPIKTHEEHLLYYAGGDFAISQSERADYTCFKVIGVNDQGMKKVVYSSKGRWDSLQIMEEMFDIERRYHPELFFVESDKIQKSIGPFLYEAMGKEHQGVLNPYMNLEPINPTKDKETRARPMQKEMRAGNVEWDTEAEWYPDAQEEYIRFPKAPHDDEVDSGSIIFLGLQKLIEAPTPQELEDEEWENEYGNEYEGQSFVCGY